MSKKATLQLCFGEDKLMKVVKEFAPSPPAQQTCENFNAALMDFQQTSPQFDDVTCW